MNIFTFIKTHIRVFNMHEKSRRAFLDLLNLTKDEKKKYSSGNLTPFSLKLSLEQPSLDEFVELLIERVPEIASSLCLEEKKEVKRKEVVRLTKEHDNEVLLKYASSLYISHGRRKLNEMFAKMFPKLQDMSNLLCQANALTEDTLNILRKWDGKNGADIYIKAMDHEKGDVRVDEFVEALALVSRRRYGLDARFEYEDDANYKTLVYMLVPDCMVRSYEMRKVLWKHFQTQDPWCSATLCTIRASERETIDEMLEVLKNEDAYVMY